VVGGWAFFSTCAVPAVAVLLISHICCCCWWCLCSWHGHSSGRLPTVALVDGNSQNPHQPDCYSANSSRGSKAQLASSLSEAITALLRPHGDEYYLLHVFLQLSGNMNAAALESIMSSCYVFAHQLHNNMTRSRLTSAERCRLQASTADLC
jgi:hypothetical protein